jgi:cytosine/uracil/thiamine/allantoin permease
MKTQVLLLSVSLAIAGVSSANAQSGRPAAAHGAALGAVTGAPVGGQSDDRGSQDAIVRTTAVALVDAVPAIFDQLYAYNWFVGFAVGSLVYLVAMLPVRRSLRS